MAGCCEINVAVRGAGNQAVPAAQVDVSGPGRTISERTDTRGTLHLMLPRPGTYRVSVSKDGYLGLAKGVEVTIGDNLTVEFTLPPHFTDAQSVTVAGATDSAAKTGDTANGAEAGAMPERPATIREALPLLPGVVRTPEGKLVISDSGEHRNALLVDSLDASDPATGNFGTTVPIDSVVSFTVYKSPFLAEFGRFSSGVVVVDTRGGGDSWHWELNDPTPEFRILGGHLRGIRGWTPRLSFNGPLVRHRLYAAESLEYVYKRTPVRTLAYPYNEDKRESWNSLSRIDYLPSAAHLLSLKLHLSPSRLMFYGLGFYNPQAVTPNRWGHEGMADLSHSGTIAGGVLQSAVSVAEVSARVGGQGTAELVMTPTGNSGNYFMQSERRARKLEWVENWTPRPAGKKRTHHLKAGSSVLVSGSKGNYRAQPIIIAGSSQQLLERIQFANVGGYRASDFETTIYAHDHWTPHSTVSLDGGLRFDRQSLTGMSRLAPRAAIAWSPFARSSTTIRAGLGWFYDRVPLNVGVFDSYPQRSVFDYGSDGVVPGSPTTYRNEIGIVTSGHGPLVFGPPQRGNFAPRSVVWKIEAEQEMSAAIKLRAAYWQGSTRELIVIDPQTGPGVPALLLSADGRAVTHQFELVSKVSLRRDRSIHLSYVHGSTRTNLNEFPEFLGDFSAPLVRPDEYATAFANIPHRFLAWGLLPLTPPLERVTGKMLSLERVQWNRGWLLAPVVEYRTGFPYSRLDERQQYAGVPNAWRFPNFFSMDLRVAKNFSVRDHAVQLSFSAFNVTNHWNPDAVRWNIADPQVGEFLGQRPRRFRIDFDVLF
ncbi:MAG: carboxypeptidase-like regulatory domain-containing protein [Candidatus Solibacter sp.]